MTSIDKHQLRPLLTRALEGDASAWEDFFRQIRTYLHAEVRKALGPDVHGLLDYSAVVQSTLRRAWERIGERFPEGAEDPALALFLAWIRRIARNRSWDEWRKTMARLTAAAGSAVENLPEPQPLERQRRRDLVAAEVAAALARLPEGDRQVVELFWFDRLSDAEIGARLGYSAGAVKVRRFRALQKLRSPKLQSLLEDSHDGRC
jgi:RNA polymerase sigma-70 factor (ECF subfamily)